MKQFPVLSVNYGVVLWISLTFLLTIPVTISAEQQPLWTSGQESAEYYEFSWPIHKIAVIGAGPR
jgi:uncharacterized membrane protein